MLNWIGRANIFFFISSYPFVSIPFERHKWITKILFNEIIYDFVRFGILQKTQRQSPRRDWIFFYCLRALFGGLFDDHETIYGRVYPIKTIDHISCTAQSVNELRCSKRYLDGVSRVAQHFTLCSFCSWGYLSHALPRLNALVAFLIY